MSKNHFVQYLFNGLVEYIHFRFKNQKFGKKKSLHCLSASIADERFNISLILLLAMEAFIIFSLF